MSILSSDQKSIMSFSAFQRPKEILGDLDAENAARILAASSELAMVIDRDGIIRDIAISGDEMPAEGLAGIVESRWVDTVTVDSRRKVEEMLNEALGRRASRWREVNQQYSTGTMPIRYVVLGTGRDGRMIALGRDLRPSEQLRKRILQAQQTMERDYARLRQGESRYRVLFQIASEAIVIVEPATRKIVEANHAAGALLGVDYATLAGRSFAKLFRPEARDASMALLSDASLTGRSEAVPLGLAGGRVGCTATALLFRQEGAAHVLVGLAAEGSERTIPGRDTQPKLLQVLNRIPDAFVLTDEALDIREVNQAFLELSQVASADLAKGQPVGRFLGRAGVDLRVLVDNLNEHGWVRNFGTVIRTIYGDQEEVELSAVTIRDGLEAAHGFVIRPLRRVAVPAAPAAPRQLPRTPEQLTELVGRVSLREIVAETSNVIERMCIEAALTLTGNNRASAAEVLGLSRQSLYSKMNRYGVGSPSSDVQTD